MVIFRAGIAVAVPTDYASQPEHVALVELLTVTSRYAEAVRVLETNAVSWLAADVLRGEAWAQRFLNTTARLSQSSLPADRRLAAAGLRALMHVLSGTPPKVGRRRAPALTPEELAAASAAIARCRALVDAEWSQDRATMASTLVPAVVRACGLGRPHERLLRALMRRRRLRRADLVLTLASWQTGLPVRRIRAARPTAALLYG